MTDLDPGIADAVAALRALGFETTDSGDGYSKCGVYPEGEYLDFAHVFMRVEPEKLVAEARRLFEAIGDGADIRIEASFNPADGVGVLAVFGTGLLRLTE